LLGLKEDYKIMLVMAVLALGMVYAFSAQGSGVYSRTVRIVDEDKTLVSQRFINELNQHKDYTVVIDMEEDGRSAIEDGDGLALLILSSDFSTSLLDGNVHIRFVSSKNDVDTMSLKNVVSGLLANIQSNTLFAENTASAVELLGGSGDADVLSKSIYETADKRFKFQNPYSVKETSLSSTWSNDRRTVHNFFGFALLFSAYSIVFGIGEILNDKAHHTWDRLLQSPVSTASVLAGNTITTLLVGFMQMAIIFVGGQLLFGIEFGTNLPIILLISFGFIFSLTGLGLFLASVLKTHAQLSATTPILLTSFAMLGGCMWPLEIVTSKILLALSLITPHRWALEAVENIMLKGLDLSSIILPLTILFSMGGLYVTAGGWMIGKMQAK